LEVEAVEPRLARIERRGRAVVIGAQIVSGAIGVLTVAIFGGQVEIAFGTDRQADVEAQRPQIAVIGLALAVATGREDASVGRIEARLPAGKRQPGDVGHPAQRGDIFAIADLRAAAVIGALELDVDHAGDRVRAILRRRAVAQHFDAIDRERGNRVEVDRSRAATHRSVDVEQCGHVTALAVDQHQGLVGREAAQRGGADHIGAVGDRWLREVERGYELVEDLVDLAQPRAAHRLRRNHVDRHRAVGDGTIGGARAGDHDGVAGIVVGHCVIGRSALDLICNGRSRGSLCLRRSHECKCRSRNREHRDDRASHDMPPMGGPPLRDNIMRPPLCNERATFVRRNTISAAVATVQHIGNTLEQAAGRFRGGIRPVARRAFWAGKWHSTVDSRGCFP
jgi:hypothetical protein